MRLGLVSSLVLAVVAVIFALQNPQSMDVNLVFFEVEGSTALVLILTFGFGVIVGLLSTLPDRLRDRWKLNQLEKEKTSSQGASSVADPESGSGSPGANGPTAQS